MTTVTGNIQEWNGVGSIQSGTATFIPSEEYAINRGSKFLVAFSKKVEFGPDGLFTVDLDGVYTDGIRTEWFGYDVIFDGVHLLDGVTGVFKRSVKIIVPALSASVPFTACIISGEIPKRTLDYYENLIAQIENALDGRVDAAEAAAVRAEAAAQGVQVSGAVPQSQHATTTQRGIVQLATVAEVNAGTDPSKAVTPATLPRATNAEAIAGTDTFKPVTPATLQAAYASWQRSGFRPTAVFIGSSNVVTGTWTTRLCAAMGWTEKNFAISGGAFHGDNFYSQIVNAAADGSFSNADVGWVFIADCSNDVRAKVNTAAATVPKALAHARATFPNARIICLPVIWPSDPTVDVVGVPGGWQNEWPMWLMADVEQIRVSARANGCEVIEHTETWLLGHPEWMSSGGDVHPNAAGHAEISRMVQRYLRGEETGTLGVMVRPTPRPSVALNINSAWVSRENADVQLQAAFGFTNATAANTDIAVIPEGMRPMEMTIVYGHGWAPNYDTVRLAIYPNGFVRLLNAVGAGATWYGFGNWRAL